MRTLKSESLKNVEIAPGTKVKRIANNTWRYFRPDGAIVTRLHLTDVAIRHQNGDLELNSGGYRTPTTKDRMPARIFQRRGEWYVLTEQGEFVFADGMIIHPDGTVTGAAPASAVEERKRLTRSINA